jgi:uncharacterized membrane protein
MSNGIIKIWSMFAAFCILFLLNFLISGFLTPTARMWLILEACVFILSIFLIIKNKLPSGRQLTVSLIFGLAMFLAYQGFSFNSITTFMCTFSCSAASFSVFNKYKDHAIKLFKSKDAKHIVISVVIGLCVGAVLGVINVSLNHSITPDLHIKFSFFLTSLSPAIFEEIAFRAFFYALCLELLNGEINSKFKEFSCYFLMVVPHAMIHTPDLFLNNGFSTAIIDIIFLSILFGLPFALLQKKRDLTSAMIAHGATDVIRFCFFGM